jgi:hypothetical protein
MDILNLRREEILNLTVVEYADGLARIACCWYGYSKGCRGSKVKYSPHQLAWEYTYGSYGFVSEERYIETIHCLTYRMWFPPLSCCP